MDKLYTSRLRHFRKCSGKRWTQMQIAEELNITEVFYSLVETGNNSPSILLHTEICLALDKPSDCFFKEEKCDYSLTPTQRKNLLSMDTEKLKMIANILQDIYEGQKK